MFLFDDMLSSVDRKMSFDNNTSKLLFDKMLSTVYK